MKKWPFIISTVLLAMLFVSVARADFGFDDLEQIDSSEQAELFEQASQAARNWHFSSAETLLGEAQQKGYAPDEAKTVKQLIASNRKAYEAEQARKRKEEERKRIEEEREARQLALQRSQSNDAENLKRQCLSIMGNVGAYSACMKKENNVFGMGKRGLNAYYAIRRECDYLAGNDNTGLSYLCQNENKNGCIGLKASQNTINACYQCNGSNLWLRVYAMGTVLRCY